MVLDYYKLAAQPFGVTPDPRYLYLGATHREALASALYGVSAGRGFTALIAKPGMGKTTLLFDFLHKVQHHARTVFLFQSYRSPQDLLRSLLADLGIEDEGSDFVRMHRKLNECLLSESNRGKRLIVVIDEAQNLDDSVLEVVRMLSNFETPREKLMHLILAGQPQLAERLASPRLIQLRQRISMIARLKPFTSEETQLYIDHRLRVAGYDFGRPMFTKQAQSMIARYSMGIPRNINNLCFNAMSLGCVLKQTTINTDVIQEVLSDLDLQSMFSGIASATGSDGPHIPVVKLPLSQPYLSSPRSWTLRLACGLALIAAAAGLYVRTTQRRSGVFASGAPRTVAAPMEVRANAVATPNPEQSAVSTTLPDSSQPAEPKTVQVLHDENLYRIAIRNFGKYDAEALAKIRALNPWLIDPNHIEAGQQILIPGARSLKQTTLPTAEQSPPLSVQERRNHE